MTAAEHLAAAEQLLAQADAHVSDSEPTMALALATMAEGHALIALGIENGAPHAPVPAGGAAGG